MDICYETVAMVHYTLRIPLTLRKDQILEDIVQEENSTYLNFVPLKIIKHRASFKKPRKTASAERLLKPYLNIGNSD